MSAAEMLSLWQRLTSQVVSFASVVVNTSLPLACQGEHKANNTYRQFYRQSALPAVTISNLQRREAPLSTCNHC